MYYKGSKDCGFSAGINQQLTEKVTYSAEIYVQEEFSGVNHLLIGPLSGQRLIFTCKKCFFEMMVLINPVRV